MYALHCTPYYYEVVHNTGKCLMFSSLNTFECCAEVQSVVLFSHKAMREQPATVMKYQCCRYQIFICREKSFSLDREDSQSCCLKLTARNSSSLQFSYCYY